ncbi:MAG: tetratricopeptide repeat protein [Opitutaceae bacterium]|nr:tetratricopeptide repeat protein [Opitutaceae bacterium]
MWPDVANPASTGTRSGLGDPTGSRWRRAWFIIPLVLVVAIYAQVLDHGYVDFDDNLYAFDNPHVRAGLTSEGLIWAFQTTFAANYHPLTWLSHMLDFELFGDRPGAFAAVNALLHAANALLVSALFARLFRSQFAGLAVGAVFAAHPVLVEGVAWISQRKTVLSTAFALGAILLFLNAGDPGRRSPLRWYVGALCAYILSLLCKSMYVTLPVVLPLLAWMEAGHNRRDRGAAPRASRPWLHGMCVRLLPFAIATCLFSLVTLWAQHAGGAMREFAEVSAVARLANAALAVERYVSSFLLPTDLSFLYPLPATVDWLGSLRAVTWEAGVTVMLIRWRTKIGISPIVGWVTFLIMLTPVLGLVQVGTQASADRYLYGPILGLLILACGGIEALARRRPWQHVRLGLITLAVGWIATLAAMAHVQVGVWSNSLSLVRSARAAVGSHPQFTGIEATLLLRAHHFEAASQLFQELIESNPRDLVALQNLGVCLLRTGRFDDAERCLRLSNQLAPGKPAPMINLAALLVETNRPADALEWIARARATGNLSASEQDALARLQAAAIELRARGDSVLP